MSPKTTRRRFLRNSAALAAPTIIPSGLVRAAGNSAPSNRLAIGIVGLGGMGSGHLKGLLNKDDCQVVAVCDVHDAHNQNGRRDKMDKGRMPAKASVEKHYGKGKESGNYKGCDAYADYRELCSRKDIDGVVVATPDHWHALIALEAMGNGKDVYCEKPVVHLFAEGQTLYKAAETHKAIFQVGSQQRSDLRFRRAAEIVRNGILGKIQKVEIGLPTGKSKPDGDDSITQVPEGLDYDFWCGPSKKLPFNGARHHWSWRWHTNFGAGMLMDWIGHHNDINNWALDLDEKGGPLTVEAVDWKMPDFDLYDAPIDYEVKCTYEGGTETSISNKYPNGIKWIGENGWVFVKRGQLEASNKEWIIEKFDRGPIKLYESKDHKSNWLDGIRTRKECIAPARVGHRSITPGHIGWISYHTGRKLKWDDATESIVNDDTADKMLKAVSYRDEWNLA